jgi:hypothetical protein
VLSRLRWSLLAALGRFHPAAWFALGWVVITLVAHFGHIYSGADRYQLGWGSAILAGLGGSSLAMFTWWVIEGRK